MTKRESLPYESKLVKAGSFDTGGDFSGGGIMRSRAELDNFLNHFEKKYVKDTVPRDNPLVDATADYGDDFFAGRALAVSLIEEPSGSVRHEVAGVSYGEGGLNVVVNRISGGIGTCDMAQWVVFTAVDSRFAGSGMSTEIVDLNPAV